MTHQVSCLLASQLMYVVLGSTSFLLSCPSSPLLVPPNCHEIAAKPEGMGILGQNSFIAAKIN